MRVDTKKRAHRDAARRVVGDNDKAGVSMRKGAVSDQVGGDHYKSLAIQPMEYILANGIGFAEGCCIKYVTRWRNKGGIEDLKKARHILDLLIEFESRASS